MKQLILIASATTALAGCGQTHSAKSTDPFKSGATTVYFTSNCSAKAADGECLQYTCKKDEKTDCSGFANGCVQGGNYYAGSAEGGKCTKVM